MQIKITKINPIPPDPVFKNHTHSNEKFIDILFKVAAKTMVASLKNKDIDYFKKELKKCPSDFQRYVKLNYAF